MKERFGGVIDIKKIRRLVTNPISKEIEMTTLYEYPAKVGTHGTTFVWLFDKPQIGNSVYGFCDEDHYSPHMKGHAFRYADASYFYITDIQNRESGDFLFISR